MSKSKLAAEMRAALVAVGFSESEIIAEYRFDSKRKWRFDFAIPSRRIAVECEGLVFPNAKKPAGRFRAARTPIGRHQSIDGFCRDVEKYNFAIVAGWHLYRCTNLGRGPTTPHAVAEVIRDAHGTPTHPAIKRKLLSEFPAE